MTPYNGHGALRFHAKTNASRGEYAATAGPGSEQCEGHGGEAKVDEQSVHARDCYDPEQFVLEFTAKARPRGIIRVLCGHQWDPFMETKIHEI